MGGWEETSPLPPSKGEMRRASRYEQYDVGTGESVSRIGDYGTGGTGGTSGSASRTGDYGTSGANRRLGKARKAVRTGTGGVLCKKNFAKKL